MRVCVEVMCLSGVCACVCVCVCVWYIECEYLLHWECVGLCVCVLVC